MLRQHVLGASASVAILVSARKGHSTLPWRPARFSFNPPTVLEKLALQSRAQKFSSFA